MQVLGAKGPSHLTQSQPSQQTPQEILVLHHLDGELGLLPPSDEIIAPSLPPIAVTAQTPLAIAVIAEARHLRDDKGVQYHAIADPLRVRILREVIEIDTGSPLMLGEMTSRPLGNGTTQGQRDAMADGGVIQTRDQGRHSEMTGRIEGEMMTTNRVADAVVAVIKDKGGCLLEKRPESEV
ncbi:uncharacterized protein TrAFT101_006940 [Trichoderma asperellum]|uniref:uncharacterized protein n=1 Tax=Trichoderma asperellum TaxID=101201 RepID=UPI003328B846|nr:hypothetical protein TrAFT101_006940 [Trichoderma asperellum]